MVHQRRKERWFVLAPKQNEADAGRFPGCAPCRRLPDLLPLLVRRFGFLLKSRLIHARVPIHMTNATSLNTERRASILQSAIGMQEARRALSPHLAKLP
jgi:hypothetical protein